MQHCKTTGVTKPECCCPDCIREQMRTHGPKHLKGLPPAPPELDMMHADDRPGPRR